MKSLTATFIIMLSLASCIKKGDKSLLDQPIQDITINLLSVSPASAVVAPNEQYQFKAVGGAPPYSFSMNAGLGNISKDGVYTAPASSGNYSVKVTDDNGNTAFALIVVGNGLQISPSSKAIGTNETFTFSAGGGISPYTYSVASGAGMINSSTGVFTTPSQTGPVTIEVRDQNGDSSFASVTIVSALTITPPSPIVEDSTTLNLDVAGGTPPYTYQVYAGDGSIDSAGAYTAPPTESTEIIRVTDSTGYYAETQIEVRFGPEAEIQKSNLPPSATTTVSSQTGTSPFSFSLLSGEGSIDPGTGAFTSPSQAATTVIRVTDANGFVDDIVATTFNLKKMTMGDDHACYTQVAADNITSETKCWGRFVDGVVTPGATYIGDEPGEMGANLKSVKLGTALTPKSVFMAHLEHSCVLFTNDKIKCFGNSEVGKTGLGERYTTYGVYENTMGDNLNFIDLGTDINTSVPAKDVMSLGTYHSCILTASGSAKCFGTGRYGGLGYGNEGNKCDDPSRCGTNLPELELGAGRSITKIANMYYSTCALIAPENQVKCWGYNAYGEAGVENNSNQIVKPVDQSFVDLGPNTVIDLASGYFHSCALLDDNSVRCWGRNHVGQLGHGDTVERGDDLGEMGTSLPVTDLGSISYPVKLFSAVYTTCALFNDGGVKCWGFNDYGQLGIASSADKGDQANEMGDNLPFVDLGAGRTAIDLAVGYRHVCATLDNNELKCWGANFSGQLGQENDLTIGDNSAEMGDNLSPVNVNANVAMSAVSSEGTCVLTTDGQLKCFGKNESGNLGRGSEGYGDHASEDITSLPAMNFGANFNAKNIFSGRFSSCAIGANNEVKCFGQNNEGVLGVGHESSVGVKSSQMGDNLAVTGLGSTLYPTKISIYQEHGCAILNTGDLKCWGQGVYGGTGLDTQADKGDQPGEMGDNLPIVDLGQTVKDIATGYYSSCAILNDGNVKCFGFNNVGQLGLEDNTNRAYHGSANRLNGYGTTNLGTGRTATQITGGHYHYCAILDDDSVKCWGYNTYGQLGLEDNVYRGNTAGDMGDNLPVVNLGSGLKPVKVDAGIYHTCALFDNGKVKCWGYNPYGQLGVGNSDYYGNVPGTMGDDLPYVMLPAEDRIVDIEVAGYSTCVLTDKNEMKCFGRNIFGQLGQGHRYNVGTDALSMGDNLPKVD